MRILRKCEVCGEEFIATKITNKYCSKRCARVVHRKKEAEKKKKARESKKDDAQNLQSLEIASRPFLTPSDVAFLLGVSVTTVYRCFYSGTLKAVRLRRKTYVRREDLDKYFEEAGAYKKKSYKRKDDQENKLQQFIDDSIDNDTKFKLSNGSEFTIDEIKGRNIIAHNDSNPKTPLIPINADEIIELLTNDVPLNIVRDIRTYFNRKFGTQPDSYAFIITKAIREMKYKTQVISANKIERKPFVFIIDEINRGEASKIFGELFYAIDPGYRGKKDIRVKTQYQNLVPETDVFAEGFYIPENVFILGTMNDIDRSIESMDFAMRRRFAWKEIKPEDTQSMLDKLECATKAKSVMARLNNEISKIEGLGPAYQVGPSYFLKLGDNGGNFEKLWNMNIEPLLREYIRGFRKSDEIMEKLRNAYFDTKESNSNINDNELVDEN